MRQLSSISPPFFIVLQTQKAAFALALQVRFLLPIQSTEHFDFKRNPRKLR
jgi:hypothetical protein